jgi:transcriptional regulator with XRE-family HTH domain
MYESGFIILGMDSKKRFGKLIAQGRLAAGMLGKDLAPELGVATSTLSNLETGNFKYPPDPEFLELIEKVLGVRKRDLAEALGYVDSGEEEKSAVPSSIEHELREIAWDGRTTDMLVQQLRFIREAQQGKYNV